MNSPSIISLKDLEFGYNDQKAVLNGFSLDISLGSTTAILGPNGTGKTTLLYIILGLLSPSKGSVHILDKSQTSYSRRQMSQLIGLVPQSEYVPFDFSVFEYVLLGRAPYLSTLQLPCEDDLYAASTALKAAGLQQMRNRPIPQLSGGERQLAMVARALAQQPRILLLDEPTAHLDLGNQDRIINILRRLSRDDVTTVFTTHNPNIASIVADSVVLLNQGRVFSTGSTSSMLTHENLSKIYGVDIEVVKANGKHIVLNA